MWAAAFGKAVPGLKQAEAAYARMAEQVVTDPFVLQLGGLWMKGAFTMMKTMQGAWMNTAMQAPAAAWSMNPWMPQAHAAAKTATPVDVDAMQKRVKDLETRLAAAEARTGMQGGGA